MIQSIEGSCVDCSRADAASQLHGEKCFLALSGAVYLNLEQQLVVRIDFTQSLNPQNYSSPRDFRLRFSKLAEGEDYRIGSVALVGGGRAIEVRVQFLNSFNFEERLEVVIPSGTQIQSRSDGVFLNSFSEREFVLVAESVSPVFLQNLGGATLLVAQSLSSYQKGLQDRDNVFVQVLQQSFLLRFITNNQVFAGTMLIRMSLPLVLHVILGTLSSTVLSFIPEYQQTVQQMRYKTLPYGVTVDMAEVPGQEPRQDQFQLFELTNNFILNNFSFLVLWSLVSALALLSGVPFALLNRRKRRKLYWESSVGVFLLNAYFKIFEASSLTINLGLFLQLSLPNFWSLLNAFSVFAALLIFA